jgi:hypothetical protein
MGPGPPRAPLGSPLQHLSLFPKRDEAVLHLLGHRVECFIQKVKMGEDLLQHEPLGRRKGASLQKLAQLGHPVPSPPSGQFFQPLGVCRFAQKGLQKGMDRRSPSFPEGLRRPWEMDGIEDLSESGNLHFALFRQGPSVTKKLAKILDGLGRWPRLLQESMGQQFGQPFAIFHPFRSFQNRLNRGQADQENRETSFQKMKNRRPGIDLGIEGHMGHFPNRKTIQHGHESIGGQRKGSKVFHPMVFFVEETADSYLCSLKIDRGAAFEEDFHHHRTLGRGFPILSRRGPPFGSNPNRFP